MFNKNIVYIFYRDLTINYVNFYKVTSIELTKLLTFKTLNKKVKNLKQVKKPHASNVQDSDLESIQKTHRNLRYIISFIYRETVLVK